MPNLVDRAIDEGKQKLRGRAACVLVEIVSSNSGLILGCLPWSLGMLPPDATRESQ